MDLKKTIEVSKIISIDVKRDYQLTPNSSITRWIDCLRSDLEARKMLDVIDPTAKIHGDFIAEQQQKRNNLVRGIISSHIDGPCHDKILNQQMQNPRLIIQHFKQLKL